MQAPFSRTLSLPAALLFINLLLPALLVAAEELPQPTLSDVRYGDHPRQKLHFWRVESAEPTAVAIHIHGGGWNGGTRLNGNLKSALPRLQEAGIAVASVEYRLIRHGVAQGVEPPVKAPLSDCARAVQFVRSKADEWNLDPRRVGLFGGSAGGCTSLWLALHRDLADPDSPDPIARLSTRPTCAAVIRAQTTLDPRQMQEWMPNSFYGGHAFGVGKPGKENRAANFKEFLARRDELLPQINEYSPYALATSDAPPIYLFYTTKPAMGEKTKDPTHSSNFGVKLDERLRELGVSSELAYPGAPGVEHATVADYLIHHLK
ncbi:alpha/beta hydrolase fold protein [Posidoniimonas corsicana]|uniref:Alpha/beta hydrolase fold protein n=1 Tax=Posidoniimonas corsicana TaxID=1938618 RepID=A0A5C5UX90_9BACT|nr:alpha/beta hydrolase [Posidoniimonas corsicana]TWT30210.1 alpha/beta hydrolase fold protein [Posidoniimonas corsicana]